MKKTSLILKGGTTLTRAEQKAVVGGKGPYKVRCNSGVWVAEVPDVNPSTTAWACSNQGGYSGTYLYTGPVGAPQFQP